MPLLLCQFVRLVDAELRDALAAHANAAVWAIGVPKVDGRGPKAPLHVPDGAYRWEVDEERRWVLTSDEYRCYSILHRPRADSEEGRFPSRGCSP